MQYITFSSEDDVDWFAGGLPLLVLRTIKIEQTLVSKNVTFPIRVMQELNAHGLTEVEIVSAMTLDHSVAGEFLSWPFSSHC